MTEDGRQILSPVSTEVDRMAALVDSGIVRPPLSPRRRLPAERITLVGGGSLDDEVAAQRK